MGFTSRKQKILKFYILIKDAERKRDNDTLNVIIPNLKSLKLTKSEIKELEFEKYLTKK